MRAAGSRYRVSIRQETRPAHLSGMRIKRLVLASLALLPAGGADLRVRIVGDAAIARWNREFMGKDRPTNVLSFPDEDGAPARGGTVSGDILVSATTCLAQTEGWREPPEERVFFFILHGMLHLAGYDHVAGGRESRRMRRKELRLFRRVLLRGLRGGRK
ncbi:MAG: rRNA maturation RNase YbeY [Thermodesulfobacteriota bacterium]